jgi:hypothetical protein
MQATAVLPPPVEQTWALERNSELRFEVAEGGAATVLLTAGNAEVHGVELALNKSYTLGSSRQGYIATFHGCSVRVSGNVTAYVSSETTLLAALEVQQNLELRREEAARNIKAAGSATERTVAGAGAGAGSAADAGGCDDVTVLRGVVGVPSCCILLVSSCSTVLL